VAAASVGHATAAVWNRIFRVGSERVAELADQLWPLLERIDFLNARGTARAASTFAVLAWPSRTNEQKAQFESLLLGRSASEDPADQHRWKSTLKGFFERVEEDALVLEPSRDLRRTLAEADAFSARTAGHMTSGAAEDHFDWKLDRVRREGIDPNAEPQRTVREASDALYERLGQTPGDNPRPNLAALWSDAVALVALLDAAQELREEVDMAAWGHVSNVVERIASSSTYSPDVDGLPSLPALFSLLQRLSASPYPKPKEGDRPVSLSWGNWDVRVYAAESWVSLAPRFAGEHPVILDSLLSSLGDPAPAVRLQFAQNLQLFSAADPELMWQLAEGVAATENHPEVVVALLCRSLTRFGRSDPTRCEALLTTVKNRLSTGQFPADGDRNHVPEALGQWVGILFVGQGRQMARAWLEEFAADPVRYSAALHTFIGMLRGHLFDRYRSNATEESRNVCDRSQEGLRIVLTQMSQTAAEARSVLVSRPDEATRDAEIKRYRAAGMLVKSAVDQLYFGSGAYAAKKSQQASQEEDPPGLLDVTAKSQFLDDYADTLAMLASSQEPGTLHHLIELYEYLIPGNSATVFESVYKILLGRGREEGYHFESLGNTAVVRIVQRYIADYRSIFEDEGRRARLVEIIRLFSEGGWAEALKLLYELPELLR
jgi:hypothetical protein